MIKKSFIADKDGNVVIQGYEEQVSAFKMKNEYSKSLGKEITSFKEFFRNAAQEVRECVAEGVASTVEFRASNGDSVISSFPNPGAESSRVSLKAATLKKLARMGYNADAMGVVEECKVYNITDPVWVEWLSGLIQTWIAEGRIQEIPEGVKPKTIRRLSKEGVQELEHIVQNHTEKADVEAARLLLTEGLKAPAIKTT